MQWLWVPFQKSGTVFICIVDTGEKVRVSKKFLTTESAELWRTPFPVSIHRVDKKRGRRGRGRPASFLDGDAAVAEAAAESAAARSQLEAQRENWQGRVDRLHVKHPEGHWTRVFITRDHEQRCGCCGLFVHCGAVALGCVGCEFGELLGATRLPHTG